MDPVIQLPRAFDVRTKRYVAGLVGLGTYDEYQAASGFEAAKVLLHDVEDSISGRTAGFTRPQDLNYNNFVSAMEERGYPAEIVKTLLGVIVELPGISKYKTQLYKPAPSTQPGQPAGTGQPGGTPPPMKKPAIPDWVWYAGAGVGAIGLAYVAMRAGRRRGGRR